MKNYIKVYPYKGDYIVHNTTNSGWIVVDEYEYPEVINWMNGKEVQNDFLEKQIKLYRLDKEEKMNYDDKTFMLNDNVSIEVFKGILENNFANSESIYEDIIGKFDCNEFLEEEVKEYINNFIDDLVFNNIVVQDEKNVL